MHLNRRRSILLASAAILSIAFVTSTTQADRRPHAGMMRYPDISATHIVFAYANDLWLAPREGGLAVPLASPPGGESFPRFSPDGQTVAFVGNYDGNRDLYTIPVTGGVPYRVTHHPAGKTLCDWTPDNCLLFFASGYLGLGRQSHLLTVPSSGGIPEKLPVPYGAVGAISPDGTWLAYTPHTIDHNTWKRYRGGMAPDIWLFNLRDHTSRKMTEWEGNDSQPMWHNGIVHYMSDAGSAHRINIWAYNTQTEQREQITTFEDFDVKWPAIGPGPTGDGEIVFQNGVDLYVLDLKTRRSRVVDISVPGDLPDIRERRFKARDNIVNGDISSTGKRAVFEARGDIWTVPAKKGSARNLTRSSGIAERNPTWSPDGRWIAYLSDETGEYELYITQSDGKGETRQLTSDGQAYRYLLAWSPDSEHILFSDKTGALYLHTLEGDKTTLIDRDPWSHRPNVSWSHDSNWIAYTLSGDNSQSAIWLYALETGDKHQVTSGVFNDSSPTFDRKGDYLFFATSRHFASPIYEDIGSTFVYTGTNMLAVVPLRTDIESPWAPESDEETWDDAEKEEEEAGDEDEDEDAEEAEDDETADDADEDARDSDDEGHEDVGDEDAADNADEHAHDDEGDEDEGDQEEEDEGEEDDEEDEEEEEVLEIDLDGFEQRAIPLPVKPGGFHNLAVNAGGKLLYVRRPARGSGNGFAIKIFDLEDEDREEKTVLANAGGFAISGDGQKILVHRGRTFAIVDTAPGQSLDKPLSLKGLSVVVNPREEWRQIFMEAWRIQRDFFYVPNMHGVDWNAMRDHYKQMLDDCVSRADLSFIIRELIAELNIGHAYYWGDPDSGEPRVPVGLLGADLQLDNGAFRIQRIITGGPWDLDARGPLSQPGVKVRSGDYLLAVNGIPLDPTRDPWAAFQGLAPGQTVALTISDKPTLEEPDADDADEDETEAATDEDEDDDDDEDEAEEDPYAGQRTVLVNLISQGRESELRYRAWVEHNRAYVAEKTAGRVGYIHVPDTGTNGQNELFRQFFGQRHKAALIIDERWNGGGQIPNRFIELLNRPTTNYWARRDGRDWPNPSDAHQGPKCMLINGLAGSGGDAFPYYFRQAGLGKLIGTRTWGGLVGISGNPSLIDGAYVSVPTFGFFENDGTWGVEGHGVDPDIEVVDDPALMVDGGDPQLDKAIEHMLAEVASHPYIPPERPPFPDRSGMGVTERDK